MKRIAVTGGSGGAGRFVMQHLQERGYSCRNIDVKPPTVCMGEFVCVDMTDYAAVHGSLIDCDALVHFAGFPHPDEDHWGAAERFNNNTVALFNAFNAAIAHGIDRIVWASSETVYGFPFEAVAPDEIPLTETARRKPQNGYAMSKAISEDLAELMAAKYSMTILGLRLSNVLYDDASVAPSYQKIPGYWADPFHRKFNLWGYVDARDCARAVRLALESDVVGAEVFNIAAADTLMIQPTVELLQRVFPLTKIRSGFSGRAASLCCGKARRLLGWEPEYRWSDVIGPEGKFSA